MDPNITCRQSNQFICQDGYFISEIKVNITTIFWYTCKDKRITSPWAAPLVGPTKHNKGEKCDSLLPGIPVAVQSRRQCRDVNYVATGKLPQCCAGKCYLQVLFLRIFRNMQQMESRRQRSAALCTVVVQSERAILDDQSNDAMMLQWSNEVC
jgi:hypothetical protein